LPTRQYYSYSLTFLGRTLGMSSEYLSTWYDSADGHMVATATITTIETKDLEYVTDSMTLLRQWR